MATISNTSAQNTASNLPKEKLTTLGLYVTAAEAHEKWKVSPDSVLILDVRTPDEYMDIGHAEMAWNIPAFLQSWQWNAQAKHFGIKPNPDFITHIKEVFKPADTILITCRSGGRSAWAVNQLAAAGYKNAYNIVDGMEGDLVEDPNSVYAGKRMVNGWKNSGLPWTYKVDPKLMKLPLSHSGGN